MEPPATSTAPTVHFLLCLKCRGTGHDVDHCPSEQWRPELDWFFSQRRRSISLDKLSDPGTRHICTRCEDLDVVQLLESLPPWSSQSKLNEAFEEEHDAILNLGKTGSIQFRSDCLLCCCLWAITPNPSTTDQDVYLLPDWSISRVSGELGVLVFDSPEKRRYATCVVSVLRPSTSFLPLVSVLHRGDALCLMEDDVRPTRTLGGRAIDFRTVNVDAILSWVDACIKRHDAACIPVPTEALREIRLIDVETRQVVQYPETHCEYIALSYVWGIVTQDHYKLDDILKPLPKTLEDALILTKLLGKRYLWADSLCIDQSNPEDKKNQIDRMWSIYRGAYLTVIGLSGSSADSGLSRLSRKENYGQLSINVKGKRLLSTMPTLSQQIWVSPWGQRAWTLQEGLLSPRCLYISDHQIYYDCASMQCCESLEEERSWAHCLEPSSNPTDEGFVTWMLRQGGAGALRIPLDWPSRRLEHWGEKLNLYSYRDMKYAEDGIRAFAGVLQRLETIYPKGFFWGLPLEDFDWALLWRSQIPPQRREGFPTWCWAGWKGPLFFGQPIDVKKTRRIQTYLQIYGMVGVYTQRIFGTRSDDAVDTDDIHIIVRGDPVDKAARREPDEPRFRFDRYPSANTKGYLFVDAIVFQFAPDFTTPLTGRHEAGQYETFECWFKGKRCLLRITSTDRYIPGPLTFKSRVKSSEVQEKWTFILIARDHISGFMLHHLMVVQAQENSDLLERATVLELLVPLDELHVVEELYPRRRRLVLT